MEIAQTLGHFAVVVAMILAATKFVDVFVWFQNERENRALDRELHARPAAEYEAEDDDEDDYAGGGSYGGRR